MADFVDLLRKLNKGKLADELSDALQELTQACSETGKKGQITLVLKLKPGKGVSPIMTVDHDIKVKEPAFERPTEFLFVTKDNALVMENPEQGTLQLRDVKAEQRGDAVVDPDTGEIIGYKKVTASA